MGKFNPDVVAQWIEQDCTQQTYQSVRSLLTQSFRDRIKQYSDEHVSELAEELTRTVSIALENRKIEYSQEGITPPFEVSIEDGDYYYKALPRPERSLLNRLRGCTPSAFEVFCKLVLGKLNAEAVVEGGPHDGGIDFYAIGLSPSPQVDPAPPSSKAVVIGQSKRYAETNDVTEVEVRSFIGGAIKKADELRKKYPDRFGLLTPLLLAFWTTGDFTLSARKFARDLGIWYLNGVGLTQMALRIGLTINDVATAELEATTIQNERRAPHRETAT